MTEEERLSRRDALRERVRGRPLSLLTVGSHEFLMKFLAMNRPGVATMDKVESILSDF